MKLFISYSRDDKAWVRLLWQALRDENYNAWMDQFIDPVSNWWETILTNIHDADCFIYVMTPKSRDSIYCEAELNYALDRGVPVFPLMLKRCSVPQRLNDALIQYQVIEDMNLDKVLYRIERGLGVVRAGNYPRHEVKFPPKPGAALDPAESMLIAEDAVSAGNFAEAVNLLTEVSQKASGTLARTALKRLEKARTLQVCGDEYAQVKKVVLGNSGELAREVWEDYLQTPCATYDPDDLASRFTANPPPDPTVGAIRRIAPTSDVPTTPPVGTPPVASVAQMPIQPDPVTRQKVPLPQGEGFREGLTRRTLEILPAPFEWIEIPAGKVTLKAGGYLTEPTTFDVDPFYIAKYPLTNAQFAPFIKANGYKTQSYWTDAGWQWCQQRKKTLPDYWNDAKWNGVEHPVVGVSWYECIAYCNWLNNVLKPENGLRVLLPTEQQWQRAAQGDDNRTYPYGNDFDASRSNT
ncbi:MAG: SUMF1/EgtB/PvdO family nonheme iron enzyme, partial [Phototrophicaceae bacterium]